jgi:hypothetical protein
MVAQVSYGSCPMCEFPKGALIGYSTIPPLDNTRGQHLYLEYLDETNIDVLHTLGVHPIHNQIWQYPLCNVCRLWQPEELHQLLLGSVKDLLHCLLKYLKARNLKDLFDNHFSSVPRYPGHQCFSKPFHAMKSGSWQGKDIWGMIRTLAVNCAPILDCSQDTGKTAAETASDKKVMVVVRALCEFSLLVSQHNHSDISLAALDVTLKRFYKKKGAFQDQKMSKSAKAKVDELLVKESHHLQEQTIHKIRAALEVQLYGVEKIPTSK